MDLDRRLVWLSAAVTLMVAVSVPVSAQVARWPDELQAGQFLCHADFPLAAYRPLLRSMPALEEDLTRLLGLQPSREWIHVFLFHNKSTYQGYVKQYFPEAPSRQALFIKDRGLGMVFAYEGYEFEVDLRHECTHALLNAALPVTPLWLDEGLAEFTMYYYYGGFYPDNGYYGNYMLRALGSNAAAGQGLEAASHVSVRTKLQFLYPGGPGVRTEMVAVVARQPRMPSWVTSAR
mgnify:CR=1 FL=1